jgi:methionine-rich copper-binding protein CopC
MARCGLALLLAAVAGLFVAGDAFAHARRVSSSPDAGAILDAAPPAVSITFSQEIQRVAGTYGISVTNAAGAEFTAGDPEVADEDRTLLSVALLDALPPGRYVVSWKNVSDADGDPAEGAFSFYVGVQPTEADLAADAELAAADEEVTPPVSATETPGETPATAAVSTSIPPDQPEDDDGGGSDAGIWIAIGAAAVGVIIGFGAVRWFSTRRR